MQYGLSDALFIALAIVLIIEGVGPMLFTKKWQRFLLQITQQPMNQIRSMGGVLFTIGLVSLFYLV